MQKLEGKDLLKIIVIAGIIVVPLLMGLVI